MAMVQSIDELRCTEGYSCKLVANENKYISFNHDEYTWSCRLCYETGCSRNHQYEAHTDGVEHRKNIARLQNVQLLTTRADWCLELQSSVDALPSEVWQRHMKQLFYDYMSSRELHFLPRLVFQEHDILSTLKVYQAREKLALLELAVWKYQCIETHAEETNRSRDTISMQSIKDHWAQDGTSVPFDFREYVRNGGAASLIAEHVYPFLKFSYWEWKWNQAKVLLTPR